jgi:hypothetical protein
VVYRGWTQHSTTITQLLLPGAHGTVQTSLEHARSPQGFDFFLVFLWVSHDYLAVGVCGGGSTSVNGWDGVFRARGVLQSCMERFQATLPAHFVDAISVACVTFPPQHNTLGEFSRPTTVFLTVPLSFTTHSPSLHTQYNTTQHRHKTTFAWGQCEV